MTRFAFAGDTHGNLKQMYRIIEDRHDLFPGGKIDYLFQVGDLGVWPSFEDMDPSSKSWSERHGVSPDVAAGDYPSLVRGEWEIPFPTYFIRGNHEDQALLCSYERANQARYPDDYLTRAVEILPNLHYIPDGHVIEVAGQKIAAWGGCWSWKTFRMEYWGNERQMLHTKKKYGSRPYAKRLEHMTRDRFERLMREDFQILLTHDAPTGCGVIGSNSHDLDQESLNDDRPEGLGVTYIRELIEKVQPGHHFCGHWHRYRYNFIGHTDSHVLDLIDGTRDPRLSVVVIEI